MIKMQKHLASGLLVFGLVLSFIACKPRTTGSSTLDSGESGRIESWVDNRPIENWEDEIRKRDKAIYSYLSINNPQDSEKYGFSKNQTPQMAWKWFEEKPVGFNGVPYVVWKTIALLEDRDSYYLNLAKQARELAQGYSEYGFTSFFGVPGPKFTEGEIGALRAVAQLWHQPSPITKERNLDHIGLIPHPANYNKTGYEYSPTFGSLKDPGAQRILLPYGLGYESTKESFPIESKEVLLKKMSRKVSGIFQVKSALLANKLFGEENTWDSNPDNFGKPSKFDNLFFACASCHVGRVVTEDGGIRFLYGAPNNEVEGQYYSQILRDTVGLLMESGFDHQSQRPQDSSKFVPNKVAVTALAKVMIMTVMVYPQKFYGPKPDDERKAYHQALMILDDFSNVLAGIIGTGAKTHFIYNTIASKNYTGRGTPDLLANRIGQMDAFGIASGLVSIHTLRPSVVKDGKIKVPGYLDFMKMIYPKNPFFTGFDGLGAEETLAGVKAADLKNVADPGAQIRKNVATWSPPGPAPTDMKNLNWVKDRKLANWDGNQGSLARTLASGTSATGDPRMVNVRIHEPLNPLIENLPPPPFPFAVDLDKAVKGKKLFDQSCTSCHKPMNDRIYTSESELGGVDPWRAKTNTAVSRYGLASLVLEACFYYMRNNPADRTGDSEAPGTDRDWCLPETLRGKWGYDLSDFSKVKSMSDQQFKDLMDDFFKDTPKRVANGESGYKADMLSGVWANAPYMHNGSIPTLTHLLCENIRPKKFIRGNINYDKSLVGFVWWEAPEKYSKYDSGNYKEYDTEKTGWGNRGHMFGKEYCGEVAKLGESSTQRDIAEAVKNSPDLEALLEYMKTL